MTPVKPIWIEADWCVPNHIHAGTTTRLQGYSKNDFQGLNLANHVGDNPDDVSKNRSLLRQTLSLPNEPVWLNQIHSDQIVCLDNATTKVLTADGSYSCKQNTICVVLTADCVPVLLTNKSGNKVAAFHAGWRGICNGILDKTSEVFGDAKDIIAWIGPCISKNNYEIGTDVYNACIKYKSKTKQVFTRKQTSKWLCDLPMLVEIILRENNVQQIYQSGLCCYEETEKFYSYRRNTQTGRTASMIWME